MDSNEIIKKLFKIAQSQQKIIHKLAEDHRPEAYVDYELYGQKRHIGPVTYHQAEQIAKGLEGADMKNVNIRGGLTDKELYTGTLPKMAQQADLSPAPTAAAPHGEAPTHIEARAIINNLPAEVKNQLVDLQVQNGQVMVKWKAPVSDAAFNAVTKTVQNLQQQNVLVGQNYKVVEKA